jgi:tetratricopeptide (TPR) repeat protein
MSNLKSVFVSYSGRRPADKDFAKRLLARLREQPLDPWVFERRGSEIPASQNIDEYCRKQIRKSDVFVAVLSDSSLESESTQSEVAFALKLLEADEIVQISTTGRSHREWPAPYKSLTAFKRIEVKQDDAADLERCVEDLCRRVGVEYSGPSDGTRRMPLVLRLTEEMRLAKPSYSRFETGTFSELRLLAFDASKAYGEGRLEHAFSGLGSLQHQLGIYYAEHAFYYPRLIRGVLLVELSALKAGYLDDAMALFQEMLRDRSIESLIDENLFAAVALVHLKRRELDDALALYHRANETVKARGMIDPDIVHNIVVVTLAAESPHEMNKVELLLEQARDVCATTDPYLYERLLALRAGLRAKCGDFNGARQLLRTIDAAGSLPPDVVARLAQDLASQSQSHSMREAGSVRFVQELFLLVAPELPPDQKPPFLMSYAGFLYGLGRFEEALKTLHEAASLTSQHPKLVVEMIWCLRQLERHEEAATLASVAAKQTRASVLGLSAQDTAEFLYYRGFAAWLSGAAEQAERDFLDSGASVQLSYSKIALRHVAVPFKRFEGLFSRVRRALH